jgi:ribosomal protein S18 acetylase RimI-like enzyme
MTPERNLHRLLASIAPKRHAGVYLFCEVPSGVVPEGIEPQMTFREGDTTTVVVEEDQAEAAGIAGELPSVWITLGASSDLAAVGFLAVITARMAAQSISVNVVSGYRHDHLFVPVAMAEDAMAVLSSLEGSHQSIEQPLSGGIDRVFETVEIRPATFEDAQALSELWERSGLGLGSTDVVPEMQACLRLYAELFLVAMAGATLAGSVWATYDGRRGWVQRLATDPEYRGHGIGSALLAEAERRLAGLGAKKVNLLIEPANAPIAGFYRRQGYESDDRLFMERFLPSSADAPGEVRQG